jgi:1,2-phenylacetyl-CoA epoxidase catalytic subunit
VAEPRFIDIVSQAIKHFKSDYLEELSMTSSKKEEFVTKAEFNIAVSENDKLRAVYIPLKDQISRAFGAKRNLKGEYTRTKNHFGDVD